VELLLRDAHWGKWGDYEIGRQCAVDHKTVAGLRDALGLSGEIPRCVERGGTTRLPTRARAPRELARYGP